LNNRHVVALAASETRLFAGTFYINLSNPFDPTRYGIYKSDDNGTTWTQTTLNNKNVWSLAANGNTIFAGTFELYTAGSGVYRSLDNGQTWEQTSLNDRNVYSIVIAEDKVYAGTENGFFVSVDNGATWTPFNDGFVSISRVYSLYATDDYLFSGTEANSVLRYDLLQPAVDLKVYLEGAFVSAQMMSTGLNEILPLTQPYNVSPWNYPGTESVTSIPSNQIVDWVLLEFRDAATAEMATPATRILRKAAFLHQDGSIVDLDGISDPLINVTVSQNLFVIVWHRNHLGVMSASPLSLSGGLYSYDFTTGAGQAYGVDAQKQLVSGKWGMYSGDGNASNTIEETDKTVVWSSEAGKMDYLNADFNLNKQVNNQDKNDFWLPNLGKSCQVPQ
jgi:hypothetical protein